MARRDINPGFASAVLLLSDLPAASPLDRWREFQRLFSGGPAALLLYESHHLDGRVPGPAAFAVKALYAQAGLQLDGPELPDHAAVELSFLAHLAALESEDQAESDLWRQSRRLFIKNHAGNWLPAVAEHMGRSPSPAWTALGHLLTASLALSPVRPLSASTALTFPSIPKPDSCSLCGFCVQACPTRALSIRETPSQTSLWLDIPSCIACRKCVQVCYLNALKPEPADEGPHEILLRVSPRALCPQCGEPTVSRAELDEVSSRIGSPDWLALCPSCRTAPAPSRSTPQLINIDPD